MDLAYTYFKKRKHFGSQPMFSEVAGHMVDSIVPDHEEQKKYILRNPVHAQTQNTKPQSLNEVNTTRIEYVSKGINHLEGGWPKDVNLQDEEAVSRFRRRVERDDEYVQAVLHSYKRFEHGIKQNNAIEMYQMYFKDMIQAMPVEKYSVATKSVYRDPNSDKTGRPVSCIAWTYEDDSKLVISYCDKTYPTVGITVNTENDAGVFNVENPSSPSNILISPSACWQVACSPANCFTIVGGLEDGRVCIFDIRVQEESLLMSDYNKAVALSPHHLAHRSPITSLIYIQSRLNTEFFTGSSDGQCMWWDIRNLSMPTEKMIMTYKIPLSEQTGLSNSEPVSALQFDRSFPTRFLCGTDTGLIINVNRKGKTTGEIMSGVFHAHFGPVKAVHRSPLTSKMFLSCGDWTAHIWSDELQSSPIITGKAHRYPINDVCWAPQRTSGYMTVSSDGKYRFWDMLRKYNKPIIEHHISRFPLLRMKIHDEGRFVAVGDSKGRTFLISLSDNLVIPNAREKSIMIQVYERETKREHILENRIKEIRLKLKAEEEDGDLQIVEEVVDEEANIKMAEDEYKKNVSVEMASMGTSYHHRPPTKVDKKRS